MMMRLITLRSCALRGLSLTQLCFQSVFSPTPGAFLGHVALMEPEAAAAAGGRTLRQENELSTSQKKKESWAQSSGPLFFTGRFESLVACVCLD